MTTENGSLEKSEIEETEETQLVGYSEYSESLQGEKESSLELLNNSAKHLIDLSKSISSASIVDQVSGDVIRKCSAHEIDVAIKALEGARQIMKTKLEFLKFGKEIIDSTFENSALAIEEETEEK